LKRTPSGGIQEELRKVKNNRGVTKVRIEAKKQQVPEKYNLIAENVNEKDTAVMQNVKQKTANRLLKS
jgi:hypothetical protein